MDSRDYITDLEEETRTLRSRVVELEEELRQAREELKVALERKVEETDESGVPPEETARQSRTKKEEMTGSGLGIVTAKREVKQEVKPKELLEPADYDTALLTSTSGQSTAQLRREPSPVHLQDDDDDDVMIMDWARRSPNKRKSEGDQPSPRAVKRQSFWVEIPPRPKKVAPVSVKSEPPAPDDIQPITTAPVVKEEPDEELANALAAIRDTSLKIDKKALDDISVFTRLSKIGLDIFPITIKDEIKKFSVGRVFLSKRFGGSIVDTFPVITKKRLQEHGFGNFMCIPLTLHPHAPSIPGAPGLWMCCNSERWSDSNMRLVVRIRTRPLALWQYMGQYDIQPSDPLSLEEWTMQSEETKREWAEHIRDGKWGGGVQTRIKHRRDNQGAPGSGEATAAEIREAFDKGEERLYTWTLKCRGYDESFQQAIWDAASSQAKSGGGETSARPKTKKPR